eukprot:TRINITY_DN24039_c0_g1_i1.p1 TRINITY_DN24039_c0_g1~~TRINITY_DN24039_c0_g1_i1.p1  ORF type:complete len:139 (+),score=47.60 TRINITY_DN24039_c0_g1_i1:59-475(+)
MFFFFFFKQKTAYEMLRSLVGSEMCIRDRLQRWWPIDAGQQLPNAVRRTHSLGLSLNGTQFYATAVKRQRQVAVYGPPTFDAVASKHVLCLRHDGDFGRRAAPESCCVSKALKWSSQGAANRLWPPSQGDLQAVIEDL